MRLKQFKRITVDPQVCTGKLCIHSLRVPVSRLLGLLAFGETKESIVRLIQEGGQGNGPMARH